MKFILTTISRIVNEPNKSLAYFLGRFRTVRLLRRFYNSCFSRTVCLASSVETVELTAGNVESTLAHLRATALCKTIRLREPCLSELLDLVAHSSVVDSKTCRPLSVDDARRHNCNADADKILILNHQSPALATYIDSIARSPLLISIVSQYLGKISKIEAWVQTSLATQASVAYRERLFQTVTFHYDVHALNFAYVFFYLSYCDETSGAHEMIQGSHLRKPLRFLLGTARRSDSEIYATYPGKSTVITGVSGSGFIEDTSCFHRIIAPISADRLALQIRYSG